MGVPLRLPFSLGLALLLHPVGVTVYWSAAVVPTVVPEIAYGLLWLWFFNPLYRADQPLPRPGRRRRRVLGARLPGG